MTDPKPDPTRSEAPGDPAPGPIQEVDVTALRSVVTELKSTEVQVGEHTMQALSQPGTVAVLTAVVLGPDGKQRIVSTALDHDMVGRIQPLLEESVQGRAEDVPCIGFHCFVRPQSDAVSAEAVDAWHAAGVANGGVSCEDPPGARATGLYLAYLRDPFGNKICAMHRPA